jgi:hypothetical protein
VKVAMVRHLSGGVALGRAAVTRARAAECLSSILVLESPHDDAQPSGCNRTVSSTDSAPQRFPSTPARARSRAAESQIEPWFARARPKRLHTSSRSLEYSEDNEMPKKTARRNSSRRPVSRAGKESGLIAKKKMLKRSAGTKSALDNPAHRTLKLSCERSAQQAPWKVMRRRHPSQSARNRQTSLTFALVSCSVR